MVGLTVIVAPAPSDVPPQLILYQYQSDVVPNVPPVIPRVADKLSQIVTDVAVIDVTSTVLVFTITGTIMQLVVLHTPSALT